jgi:hypothetical protein
MKKLPRFHSGATNVAPARQMIIFELKREGFDDLHFFVLVSAIQ